MWGCSPSEVHALPVQFREMASMTSAAIFWLVSKAGPRIEALTRQWLTHWRFLRRETGLPPSHVAFCRERKEKAVHARKLRLSHFIDDRLDVHHHLRGIVGKLYLFGHQRSGTVVPTWVTHVATWSDVRRVLLETPLPDAARGR